MNAATCAVSLWVPRCFFSGLGIVLYAEQTLLASLGQELLAAVGLVLSVVGGLTALLGYIALSFSRIFKLTQKDD